MYCSRCSAQIGEDLNFCSTCGERVNKGELTESSKKQSEMLDNLAIAAIIIGCAGLLFLVGLVAVLIEKAPMEVIVVLTMMYLAAWFGVLYKLLTQISKLVDANLEERKFKKDGNAEAVQLPPVTTAQLEEFREPASVVENTTRTLDKVPVR